MRPPKNPSTSPITPSEWRLLFASAFSTDDFLKIAEVTKASAMDGNLDAARLVLERLIGKSRAEAILLPPVELPATDNVQGCLDALAAVLDAQVTQRINEDQAESLRRTIRLMLQGHRTALSEDATEKLEEMGSIPFYPEAGREVESYAEWLEATKIHEG